MDQESTTTTQEAPAATPEVEAKPEAQAKTFDADYVKTLRAEAAKYRTEAQEAKAKAQEYEDSQKSELEKAHGKLTKMEQAKAESDAKLLRYEVAQEKEVPAKLVPLLTATNREDLEVQAALILDNVKAGEPSPDFDGGPRDPAPEPKTPDQAHNELAAALFGQPRT